MLAIFAAVASIAISQCHNSASAKSPMSPSASRLLPSSAHHYVAVCSLSLFLSIFRLCYSSAEKRFHPDSGADRRNMAKQHAKPNSGPLLHRCHQQHTRNNQNKQIDKKPTTTTREAFLFSNTTTHIIIYFGCK